MNNFYGFREYRCSCCNKSFYITSADDYAYKERNKYFCSWSCMQNSRKK